jgi:hypothetical protein
MNNDVVIADQITDLKVASIDQLRRELSRALQITSKHLVYLGAIWRELEERGVDLSDLRSGIAAYLPMIAHERLNAELVVKYAGQKMLLNALAQLPMHEQNTIAKDGFVTVVKLDGDDVSEIQVPLTSLSSHDVYRVFSDKGVRPPSEQVRLLSKKPKPPKRPRRARRVALDREDASIVVGQSSVSIDRLICLISDYYKTDIAAMIAERDHESH